MRLKTKYIYQAKTQKVGRNRRMFVGFEVFQAINSSSIYTLGSIQNSQTKNWNDLFVVWPRLFIYFGSPMYTECVVADGFASLNTQQYQLILFTKQQTNELYVKWSNLYTYEIK